MWLFIFRIVWIVKFLQGFAVFVSISESLCIQLRLDLEGADVSPEGIEAAVRFGVRIHHEDKSVDAKTYVVAFFRKLLLQREKIDRGLLVEEINPRIARLWQEVLSTLEERKRKVLEIQSGSIVFNLFCPTKGSMKQLQDELWARTLTTRLEYLLQSLGKTLLSELKLDLLLVFQEKGLLFRNQTDCIKITFIQLQNKN